MVDLIFATKNNNKMNEIREILADTGYNPLSLLDIGIDIDVVEDCSSFEGNAEKKAREICAIAGKLVIADDSGIEIDFLGKAPGVRSARYLGENTPYDVKNTKILELLRDVPFEKRTARFVCAIVAAYPGENGEINVICEKSAIEGYIHIEPAGENGFGYDPIFFVPEYNQTTAQMPPALKNSISHRGKALEKMKKRLLELRL